jgi:hypothetical protein
VLAVAWRALAVVLGLTLLYLGGANLVLVTPLLRNFAADGGDLKLTYDSAYSVWPGRVKVQNLGVRFEDHNVQMFIGIERGTLDVSLHELALKRFHALRVDGENVVYRMRHKLKDVGLDATRVAAYPPIEGFADPPLFKGPPPPPIPDEEYALWDVTIENVTARVKEIWVLEYRYRGPGVARGSFHVKPARNYDVRLATLDLAGGKVTLGDKVVAERAAAKIEVRVAPSDTRKLTGLEPLRAVDARIDARFDRSDFAFLDAYLGPHAGLSAGGRGDIDVHLGVQKGAIGPDARLLVATEDAWLGNGSFRARGPATWTLESVERPANAVELGFAAKGIALESRKPQASGRAPKEPRVDAVDVRLRTTRDLTRPLEVLSAELKETRVTVPDLGWIPRSIPAQDLPGLAGRATLTASAKREGDGRASGKLELAVADMILELPDRSSHPFAATLTTRATAEGSESTEVRGTASLHVDRASALLPLLSDSAFLREIQIKLLKLGDLTANGMFRVGKYDRFDLTEARSGIARARGHLTAEAAGPRGAFLVTTPAANLGVLVAPSATRVRLFVADDWLEKGARESARGGLARPERGRLSR